MQPHKHNILQYTPKIFERQGIGTGMTNPMYIPSYKKQVLELNVQ